jgi:hypothetical protein
VVRVTITKDNVREDHFYKKNVPFAKIEDMTIDEADPEKKAEKAKTALKTVSEPSGMKAKQKN